MNSRHFASERFSTVLLAASLGVCCGAAGQPGGQARAGGFNFNNVVYFYDTENRAGIGYLPENVTDAWTELWIEDDIYTDNHITYGTALLPYATGTPVILRSWWPPVGCIAGYNAIGAIAPTFLLPTEASRVPYGIYSEPSEGENRVDVAVEVYLSDSPVSKSIALQWVNANGYVNNRPITLWADYLPGNALQSEVHSSGIIPDRANRSAVHGVWTQDQHVVDPATLYLGTTEPLGPLRMSVGMEGYTTDTICLNIESERVYRWRARLSPIAIHTDPGPSASFILERHYGLALPPPPLILQRAYSWQLLGLCDVFSNIEPYMGGNADAVNDVADLIVSQSRSTEQTLVEEQP